MIINEVLLYTGGLIVAVWGFAHIMPVKSVVEGFEPVSRDNKLVIIMEWMAEGLFMIFSGILVIAITFYGGYNETVSVMAFQLAGSMLLIMAVLHLFTGARTSVLPLRICPVVITISAILILIGSMI